MCIDILVLGLISIDNLYYREEKNIEWIKCGTHTVCARMFRSIPLFHFSMPFASLSVLNGFLLWQWFFFLFGTKSLKNDGHCHLSSLAYENSFIEKLLLMMARLNIVVLSARSLQFYVFLRVLVFFFPCRSLDGTGAKC